MRYKSAFYEDSGIDIRPEEINAFVLRKYSSVFQEQLIEEAKLYKHFVFPVVKGIRLDEFGFCAWFKTYDDAVKFIEKERTWTNAK